MSLADNRRFLAVTRGLLRSDGKEPATAMLARLGVPTATGYRIFRFYAHHGALRSSRAGMEVDHRKIVTLAGGLRADRAVPDRELTKCPPLAAAARVLGDKGIAFVAAFRTAANRIGYFEPAETMSLYVGRPEQRELARLLTVPGQSGRCHLHHEDLSRLEAVRDADGIPITSPMQTLLDLAADPLGGAHRSFLEELLRRRGELPA